jgi:serine/threonine protein kinase
MPAPRIESIGRYKVLGVLGKGAMGVVYKGIDPVIDREVAIKTIRLSLSEDELAQYEARFAQEIKTVGKLTHPHIVPIYDVGRTEQFAYMAMEFIDGFDLKAYMATGKPLDVATTLDIIAQVADGLAFAHAREIVHRDVKPSNVMVARTEDGMVAKVMDFGIARGPASTVKTQTGMIMGSPRYMSPEHVTGRSVTAQSDVFSLGVMLYEMLAGMPPFEAESVTSIMYQTVNVPEAPPSTRNREVKPELDALVALALGKKPEQRFATMREFHKALREMLKTLPEPGLLPVPAAPATQTLPGFPAPDPEDLGIIEAAPPKRAPVPEAPPPRVEKSVPVPAPAAPHATPAHDDGPFPVLPAALLGSLAVVAVVLGIALLFR